MGAACAQWSDSESVGVRAQEARPRLGGCAAARGPRGGVMFCRGAREWTRRSVRVVTGMDREKRRENNYLPHE